MKCAAVENPTFGERLKEYRLDRGWTLQHMARLVSVSIETIRRVEMNRVKPHDLTMRKLTKALPGLEA